MSGEFVSKTSDSQIQTGVEGLSTQGPAICRGAAVAAVLLEHPLVQEALKRLNKELPAGLAYHNYNHTMDVFNRAIELAVHDGLDENDVTLIAIAAAWHDTGFIVQPTQNEPIAATWARAAMRAHGGYSEQERADVAQAILDTQIQFNPTLKTLEQRCVGRLSPWVLDADLANFGQTDFMVKSAQVYAEFSKREITSVNDFADEAGKVYVANTIRMLATHKWHSPAAQEILGPQEIVNRARIGHLLAELHSGTEAGLQAAWVALTSS